MFKDERNNTKTRGFLTVVSPRCNTNQCSSPHMLCVMSITVFHLCLQLSFFCRFKTLKAHEACAILLPLHRSAHKLALNISLDLKIADILMTRHQTCFFLKLFLHKGQFKEWECNSFFVDTLCFSTQNNPAQCKLKCVFQAFMKQIVSLLSHIKAVLKAIQLDFTLGHISESKVN